MLNFVFPTEQALAVFAAGFAEKLQPGTLIFLKGPLGAGKTFFVRHVLRALNFLEKVKSPTYALVETYPLPLFTLYHMDLYRLGAAQELYYLGVSDYPFTTAVFFIEWAEKGAALLPQPDLIISIAIAEQGRCVTCEGLSVKGNEMLLAYA